MQIDSIAVVFRQGAHCVQHTAVLKRIGRMMGAPSNTVLSWLRRARAQLPTMLKEEIEEDVYKRQEVTYLDPSGSQIGKKESIADTARVLGRMFDGIEYRGYGQQIVEDLAPVSYTHLDVYKRQV